MTPQQSLEDALLIRQVLLIRVANGQVFDVYADLTEVIKELRQVVQGFEPMTQMGRLELNRKIKEINNILEIKTPDLEPIAELEAQNFAKIIEEVLGDSTIIPTDLAVLAGSILISGATLKARLDNIRRNAIFNMEAVVRNLVAQGASNAEIALALTGDLRRGVRGGEPMKQTMRHVTTEIRTAIMAIASQAREEFVNANSDLFNSATHNSVLDSKTSDVCLERDGKSWRLPNYEPIGHVMGFRQTPLHRNCRSLITYNLSGQSASFFQKGNFDDFLGRQDEAKLNVIFGEGNVDSYRNGKRSFTQLVDNKNNTLPISKLNDEF